MKKTGNTKNSKQFDLLKMCMKYLCRSTHNHVKSDLPKKHIYLASQYDELLAVLVQIYKLRMQQSNIPHDQFFPILLQFFKIKFYA